MTDYHQQQQLLEREQRLVEALDRFHQGKETEDDLAVIAWETGLTNYRPKESAYVER